MPSAVDLLGDPGHGDRRDGGDEIELHVAQPGQIVQLGIAQEVDVIRNPFWIKPIE